MLTFDPQLLSVDDIGEYTWDFMPVSEAPSAEKYLEFAEADLAEGKTPRHLVNSIANAKRALHLRIEDLCLGFGSVSLSRLSKFPLMLEYIRKCGVVAPTVLSQINSLRNKIEHDFTIPMEQEATTFLGVVALFLSATDRWITRRPLEIDYFKEVADGVEIYNLVKLQFDWRLGIAKMIFRRKGESWSSPCTLIEFASPSTEFFACVCFALTNSD